jgi:glutathione reductase (NADPH)
VADQEALVAASAILGAKGDPNWVEVDYGTVPALLFTYPQYGMVGKTEQTLRDEGVPYTRSFGQNLSWPTYRRIGMAHAAYKILVGEDGRFLGAHFLADNASGLTNAIRLAMLNRTTAEALYRQSFLAPYPSRESDMVYMLKPLV